MSGGRAKGAQAVIGLHNRQRLRKLDLRASRRLVHALLTRELRRSRFDLGIYFVGAVEMTRLNETFLRHRGSTDVITFDYSDCSCPDFLHGEVFVCVEEAVAQARRFRTTWRSELTRYIIHGVLHLCGYDDRTARERNRMRKEEDRLLKRLAMPSAE